MKKIFFTVLAAAASNLSIAQKYNVEKDTVINVIDDRYKVETNHFWDNWFLGASGGAQVYFGDHNKQMELSERVTPNFEINLGKWFSPGLGVRAGVNGFKIKGVTQNGSHSTGEVYQGKPWDGYWLNEQEFEYFHLHGDVLFNLTNILGGYRSDRVYNLSPYVGLGWMVTNNAPAQKEVSANIGVYNTFRLSNAFDIALDVRGAMVNDRFDGETGNRHQDGLLSAMVGITYNFKKRDWDKPSTMVISYSDELLNRLREKVRQLSEDNSALRKQLASAKATTITDIKIQDRILAAPILITFPINKSFVSNEARVNLGYFAKVIGEGSRDVVYTITGYADEGTGNPEINQRLSRERAQNIYNVLVNEFHVEPRQLEVLHMGGVDNMFYDDPRLSRAVITIAK